MQTPATVADTNCSGRAPRIMPSLAVEAIGRLSLSGRPAQDIVDYYGPSARLVVELDGRSHDNCGLSEPCSPCTERCFPDQRFSPVSSWCRAPSLAMISCRRRSPGRAPTHRCRPPMPRSGFRVPEGFHVSVFAAEPDVQNPIAMAWDRRGRLWIAENYTYAERAQRFDLSQRDRVLIFEDSDGDGQFDRRTVFTDQVQMLASIELGFGGAWLLCPPRLLFLPDRDGDDVPDGPAEVVLDGFTVPAENYHTFANGLQMGARRLAVRPLRSLVAGPDRAAGHARCAARARSAAASGVITRIASGSRPSPRHDQPLGPRLERARRALLRQHGQRPPLAHDPRRPLRSPAHDRSQPAGLRPDRPARRPLALGPFEGTDPRRRRARRQPARRRPRS